MIYFNYNFIRSCTSFIISSFIIYITLYFFSSSNFQVQVCFSLKKILEYFFTTIIRVLYYKRCTFKLTHTYMTGRIHFIIKFTTINLI